MEFNMLAIAVGAGARYIPMSNYTPYYFQAVLVMLGILAILLFIAWFFKL